MSRPAASRTRTRPVALRMVLLAGGGFALLAGLDAALLLLGVGAPVWGERLTAVHGLLMVLGFVGTLIALERAVALHRRWGFAAPALTALGGIALVSPLPLQAAGVLLVLGTGVQAAVFVPLWRRRRDPAVLVQALGAVAAVGAAVLFTGGASTAAFLPWLVAFVVLLIAGERMELARLGRSDDRAERAVLAAAVLLLVVVVLTLLFPGWALPVLGLALLVLVGALLRVDVAVRMLRGRGLPRFSAACLLAGYGWLSLAGAVLLVAPDPWAGGGYDAVVHAVFLGFTVSMIFAHAPVILPAVLHRPLPYHPAMYVPAALLHAALLLRVAGDLRGARLLWQVGGVGNVVAVLAFLVTAIAAAVAAGRRRGRRPGAAGGTAAMTGP
ncbi:MAG TPA: hypothetical protein VFM01_09125, partial [Nakamurella sp.]|nr:hypothetical protein [Nakamurella sp.]